MNHYCTERAVKPELEYPFKKRWSPQPGEPFEVADGVYWLRQPLPIALDHINLWILRDGDGWTIVDSGYDHADCKAVWEQVFNNFLSGQTINRVIITHFHPDHIGLASWLAQRCDCSVWISRGEFNHYHDIVTRDPLEFTPRLDEYVQAVGLDHEFHKIFAGFFNGSKKAPAACVTESICHFIADTQEIEVDGAVWRVVTGNGHSPEHACLYCPEKDLMIAGDQAIARISSNVSVYPGHMSANPLRDWLLSCAKLQSMIPNNTLILPAHQEPFIGIHERMQQLIDDHHADLNRLRNVLHEPLSVSDVRRVLYDRELSNMDMVLATGEALAHLNYLIHTNEISMRYRVDGSVEYSLI